MEWVWKILAILLFGSALVAALRTMVWLCKVVLEEEPETNTAWDPLFIMLKLAGVVIPFGATVLALGYLLLLSFSH